MGYLPESDDEKNERMLGYKINVWRDLIEGSTFARDDYISRSSEDVPTDKERNVNNWFGPPIIGLERFIRIDHNRISRLLIANYRVN